jgi:hypothetical protein
MKRVHAARSLGSVNDVEVNCADRSAFPRRPKIQTFPDLRINYVLKQVAFCASRKLVYTLSITPTCAHEIHFQDTGS